ncbi:GNAT family N-acetyltransferase [Sinorhizobium meliloti]|uniref:GNAT family N-acetyltransferase n=1 Tax=Rhizobium meliloti TaxID=382 RepID=UPI0003DCA826|nr:hypothetical protein [Sinorhizobium meliloti]ARS70865.1 hypothetical protein SMRU11_28195 [Sinorhizobium meliloti RU11/001]RVM38498.1 hypothetical protein CN129_07520 [Sinorhizobium meliloti]
MSAVRQATASDVPRILTLLRNFHAAGGFDFRFDAARFEQFVKAAIFGDRSTCFVIGDPIAGVLVASHAESFVGFRYAEEHLVWIEPGRRGAAWSDLLRAFEAWAKAAECARIKLSAQHALRHPAMTRLYRRSGYMPCETVFSKEI